MKLPIYWTKGNKSRSSESHPIFLILRFFYSLECTGYILDVAVDNGWFYPIIIKCHPALSLLVRVNHHRKGLQEDFRSMMKRNMPVKLKKLSFCPDIYYTSESSYVEGSASFSKEDTAYFNCSQILKVPYFLFNIKGKFRWTSETDAVFSPKYGESRKKREALLTSDTETKCVIWEASISDICKILGGRREAFICLTNMKKRQYEGIKFETTTETSVLTPPKDHEMACQF